MRGDGRVALVTGLPGGIGGASVEALGAAGWAVAPRTDRERELSVDLTHSNDVTELVGLVLGRLGRLDLVVSCPAAFALAPVDVHSVDDWWRVIDANLGGSFRLARATAPHLLTTGGSLVFVSSEWALTGWAGATAYCASMAGLVGLTKALARELAPHVRVNAVAPGIVDSPQLAVDAESAGLSEDEIKRQYAETAPLRRIAAPAEIAATILFLASDDASYYTGQVLSPNGGRTRA